MEEDQGPPQPKAKLDARVYDGGKIEIDESWYGLQGQLERVTQHVMDTKEEMTRKALIELGWTPPEGADQ